MASGHVSRANRPNTWLHRPMLLRRKKSLPTRSRPHMADSVEKGRARVRSSRPFNLIRAVPIWPKPLLGLALE
jgi:hypothetical protein